MCQNIFFDPKKQSQLKKSTRFLKINLKSRLVFQKLTEKMSRLYFLWGIRVNRPNQKHETAHMRIWQIPMGDFIWFVAKGNAYKCFTAIEYISNIPWLFLFFESFQQYLHKQYHQNLPQKLIQS